MVTDEMIDTPSATPSGWHVLMMVLEHEVHHHSQIDAYAGLQGWPVPDIFNRSAETIGARSSPSSARVTAAEGSAARPGIRP